MMNNENVVQTIVCQEEPLEEAESQNHIIKLKQKYKNRKMNRLTA